MSGASLQWFKDMDGKQLGNPRSAAQAIIQTVESPHPPMRLALGTDAMSLIQEKLEWVSPLPAGRYANGEVKSQKSKRIWILGSRLL